MNSIILTLVGFVYTILLMFFYFFKKKIDSQENQAYSSLIISNFVEIFIGIFLYVFMLNYNYYINICYLLNNLYLICLSAWAIFFTQYIVYISFVSMRRNKKRIVKYISYISLIIIAVLIFISKSSLVVNNNGMFSVGDAANLVYFLSGICATIIIYSIYKNFANIKNKKYLPLYTFIVLSAISLFLQKTNPELNLMLPLETFITFLIYFTIENPDLKIIDEFKKSKDLSKKNNEEKETYLTNLSQKTKMPLNNIDLACNQMQKLTKEKRILDKINYISDQNKIISYISNIVLSFDNVDETKMPRFETKYDIIHFANNICNEYSKKVNKNVDLRIEIEKNIPEYLYGDGEKVKKIIETIIKRSVSIVDEGFLEIGFHEIIRDNVCRLLVRTECTSNKISQQEFNNIFLKKCSLEENNDLVEAKRISDSIGGILFGVNAGVIQFSFILDQIIYEKNNATIREIEKYSNYISLTNVLLVSENNDFLKDTMRKLSKYNLNIEGTTLAAKCIEKVRNNKNYDYILLDENIELLGVNETLKKLKEITGFNSKVIVLTNNIKNNKYIKNGFDGELTKSLKYKEIVLLEDRSK